MNIDPDLVENVPVPHDGYERAVAAGNRTLLRRRAGIVASCTLLSVFMVIGILAARNTNDEHLSTAGSLPPATTAAPRTGPPLLALPAAALAATPAVPTGWQTVDYGFGEISVPGDWQPLLNAVCFITVPAVYLGDMPFATNGCAVPSTFVRLTSATNACRDTRVLPLGCVAARSVNGLTVEQINPGKCACGTVSYYIADLQLRIDFTTLDGAATEQILNTITPSPQAKVLAEGPLADTSNWRLTTDHAVGIRAPNDWRTKQLTATDATAGGCGHNPMSSYRDTVLIGQGGRTSACPPVFKPGPPSRIDGVWLSTHTVWSSEPTQQEVIDFAGKRVFVEAPAGSDSVNLEIPLANNQQATIAIGIGSDLSIARTIARTITVNEQPLNTQSNPQAPTETAGSSASTNTPSSLPPEGPTRRTGFPMIVEHPNPADKVVLRNGNVRFELPRPDDQPQTTGSDVWAAMEANGAQDPSTTRIILLRYTNLIQGIDQGNGSVLPDSVDRLVWVAAVIPLNAPLSSVTDDQSPYSFAVFDAATGKDLGLIAVAGGPRHG